MNNKISKEIVCTNYISTSRIIYNPINDENILKEIFSYVVGNKNIFLISKKWNNSSKKIFENKAIVFVDKNRKILGNKIISSLSSKNLTNATFLEACTSSNVNNVKLLLADRRINSANKSKGLINAFKYGRKEIVDLLIQIGKKSDLEKVKNKLTEKLEKYDKAFKICWDLLADSELNKLNQKRIQTSANIKLLEERIIYNEKHKKIGKLKKIFQTLKNKEL